MDSSPPRGEAPIGILLFSSAGRIAGDPGHPDTFSFPVRLGLVEGSYRDLITGSEQARQRLRRGAAALAEQGAAAIAGDCGLMSLYQADLADASGVPVVASSLMLLPQILRMLPSAKTVGILTGHSDLLGEHHLRAAGVADSSRLTVQGMEEEPHFREVVIDGGAAADFFLMRRDVLSAAGKLLQKAPDTGAIVLECSNLATFAGELRQEFSLPVFDINSAVEFLHRALYPPSFSPTP